MVMCAKIFTATLETMTLNPHNLHACESLMPPTLFTQNIGDTLSMEYL